jgi:hypothetical protein
MIGLGAGVHLDRPAPIADVGAGVTWRATGLGTLAAKEEEQSHCEEAKPPRQSRRIEA